MFNYIEETLRSYFGTKLTTVEEIQQRLYYCEDKLKNIKRLNNTPKQLSGCIEAREDMSKHGLMLYIVDVDKEYFIKVNTHQSLNVILLKGCEELNKNPSEYELIYDESTMNMNDSIYDIFILLNNYRKVENPGTLYFFPK